MNHIHYALLFLYNRVGLLLALSLMLTFLFSCRGTVPVIEEYDSTRIVEVTIPRMGYAIQAGAFSRLENAVRLTESIQKLGLDPYYFKDDSGLYKVRFGNFPSSNSALTRANNLRESRIIAEFYIVSPEDYPWRKDAARVDIKVLRKDIVRTAKSFIGVPYRFGGKTSEEGLDCSGLTMASYRLNGLELPRTSRQQWATGRFVDKHNVLEADLVFFDTTGKGRVSHVGVYIGNGQFVHAPKSGKTIRIDSISNSYFKRCYLGARTYL